MGRKFVNVAQSQTDSEVVAVKGLERIEVLSLVVFGGATDGSITFNSKGSGAGTAEWPTIIVPAKSTVIFPLCSEGWLSTKEGEALTCSTGTGPTLGVAVNYRTTGGLSS